METIVQKNSILSLLISKAVPEDGRGIQELTAEASKGMYRMCGWSDQDILNHFPPEKIISGAEKLSQAIGSFTDSEILMVAKDPSGNIVGSCYAERKGDKNRIEAMYIRPEYQGSGLAKKLYAEVYKELNHSLDTYLDVFSLNIRGVKFYKKLGFLETGKKFFDKEYSNSGGSPLEITEMRLTNKKHSYKDRKYDVVPYDQNWPKRFEEYKARLDKIFGNVQIEHIGSTSVPGMAGKTCIDVLVIIDDLQVVENHISDMEQAGFEYAGPFVMKDSLLFREMKDNALSANIHFFPVGHPHSREMLDLRNFLLSHPEEVEAYSNLKNELYLKYQNDYASYRKFKDAYMGDLKKRVSET